MDGQADERDDRHGVVLSTAHGDGARLVLSGTLDEDGVDRLRALLDDVAASGEAVRIDLSRSGRLPLGVLQALAAAHRRMREGESLLVVDASPAALRALRTSGLDRALRVEGPAAPAAVAGPAAAVS